MQSPTKRQRLGTNPQPPGSQLSTSCTLEQFRDQAAGFLSGRLCSGIRCDCMSMEIRKSLQTQQNDLVQLVEGTIAGRENASIMILGESGAGKTLVSGTSSST